MKKFYAEKAIWGANATVAVVFNSRKERDEYVKTTDYTNKITAKEAATKAIYTVDEL